MFGSHAPRPIATPKNAVKQIIPAMTRVGNMRNTTAKGSLLVLLAASVESELKAGTFLISSRLSTSSASCPRPCVGAADEMHDRQNASANEFRRIFAGIGEGERLFGTKTEPGDEAADDKHRHVRRKCADNGEHTEQQQVELIDEAAAVPVAELTLPRGADEHAEDRRAADQRDFRAARELRRQNVRHERAEDRKVDDVEEISRGDECDDSAVQRRYLCLVERVADVCLYGLSHGLSLPIAAFAGTQQPIRMSHNLIIGQPIRV